MSRDLSEKETGAMEVPVVKILIREIPVKEMTGYNPDEGALEV